MKSTKKGNLNKVQTEFRYLRDNKEMIDSHVSLKEKNMNNPFKSSKIWMGRFRRKIFYHPKAKSLSKESIQLGILHEAGHLANIQNYHKWLIITAIPVAFFMAIIYCTANFLNLEDQVKIGLFYLIMSIFGFIPIISFSWHLFYEYLQKDEIKADEFAAQKFKDKLIDNHNQKMSEIFSNLFKELEEISRNNQGYLQGKIKTLKRKLFPDFHPDRDTRVDLIKEKFD